jgi:alpha-2-macroglobulin
MKRIFSESTRRWVVPILLITSFSLLFSFFSGKGYGTDFLKGVFQRVSSADKESQVSQSSRAASFTITKIEPNLAGNVVKITFTETCALHSLRRFLKIFPPVKINWNGSRTDRNDLYLKAEFKAGQGYSIVLPESFECNGLKYAKTVDAFKMPDLLSDVHFMENATVVERDSRQMIHVSVTNVNELKFEGLQIPPALIPLAMRRIETNSSFESIKETLKNDYKSMKENLGASRQLADFMGDLTEDSQVFFPRKERNKVQQFSIPMNFRSNKEKGAIEVVGLRSNRLEDGVFSPVRLLRITDLGITYKISEHSLLLWVTSLRLGKPLKNVSLLAFLRDSSLVPLGKTDEDGVLLVKNLETKGRFLLNGNRKTDSLPLPLQDIEIIAASSSTDGSFIDLRKGETIKPDWVVQSKGLGEKLRVLKGHLFSERGIYRPGEKVFFKGTVREYRDGTITPPAGLKPVFILLNSKNEEIYRREMTLSEFGTASDTFEIRPYFPLGTYTLRMQSEELVAITTFEVQEFQAPRHFVEILFKRETKKDESYVNFSKEIDVLTCNVTGKYYAGGPVKHGKVRWKTYYTSTSFRQKEYPEYIFGNRIERSDELVESGESILDEKGQLAITFPIGKDVASGLYGVEVVATVLDFDGRASTETAVFQEEPEYLIGISSHESKIQAGTPQILKVIAVHKNGAALDTGKLNVEVMKNEVIYIRKRNEAGDVYWEQKEVFRKQLSTLLAIEKKEALFDFDFVMGGKYILKFTYQTKDGKGYSSSTLYDVEGYFYGYEYESRERKFERLSVFTEKKEYSLGDTIRVYIQPHKRLSSLLMTVERQGILQHRTVTLSPDQKFIEVRVDKTFEPNVYLSFLGIVARGDFPLHTGQFDDEAPQFLFGVVNVDIKKESRKLKVAINEGDLQLKAEPGAHFKLKLSAKDETGKGIRAEMAVCVVDESILALTGFRTPVLEALTRFMVPLSVFTRDLRSELLRQTPYGYIRNEPLTGGGGLQGGKDFSTTKLRKDFRPVAYCNMTLKTDPKGEAEAEFNLPDTMTTYRVYVVACDPGSQFVSYERNLLVVKDFYVEPGAPRFFTRGDRFKFSVSAFNKTNQSGTVKLGLEGDRLVSLSTEKLEQPLKAYDRVLLPVQGEAMQPGISNLVFSGKFKNKEDAMEIKVPVKSGYLLWNDVVFGTMRNSASINYLFPEGTSQIKWSEINPHEVQAILTISGSPFIRLSKGLRYLLTYPYGCVEQTSSGVLPLSALRGLIKDGFILDINVAETDKFLKPGIERLLSMQTDKGGFGYWPGDIHPHPWGTIYATSALTQAGRAGFDVPPASMNKAMKYLQEAVRNEGRGDDSFRGYASYVLALNRSLDESLFRELYRDIRRMPREGALLLLLAGKIGNFLPEKDVTDLIRAILEKEWTPKGSYYFSARYREPSIALIAGSAVLRDDALLGKLAKELLDGTNRQGIWTSTSDTGWALVALGEYLKGKSFSNKPVSITLRQAGKPAVMDLVDPLKSFTFVLDPESFLKKPEIALSADDNVDLIYMLSLTFPRIDFASKGYTKGFKIQKAIENMDGSREIKVGDIVKVKLTIEPENSYSFLVVDDPLPAGLVAINSAIKTEERVGPKRRSPEGTEEEDDYWGEWEAGFFKFVPSFFEIRDDRVLVFKDHIWRGSYQYAYYARAVCEGEFLMPSTKIQLMYEPDTFSLTPVEKVVIRGRE